MSILKDLENLIVKYSDKILHFTVSSNLFLTLTVITDVNVAALFTLLIGFLYEAYGNKDWFDLCSDVLGLFFGILLYYALRGLQ